jgi:release factor glutamine methyltransferase
LNIKELKQEFISNLSGIYPLEEVQSFFTLLIEKYLSLSRVEIVLKAEEETSENSIKIFRDAINRLKKFEPIQYIIGETEFYGLIFKVVCNVLIPRPETEELVKWILDDAKEKRIDKKATYQNPLSLSILDIGTGSGCISVALAHHLPNAEISGIDISKPALKLAKQNAILNKAQVGFVRGDILSPEQDLNDLILLENGIDIIVSNPPYVREQEKEQIAPNVIRHEPAIALFVKDSDPLIFYRRIAQFAKKYLKPEGVLYFEINQYLYKDLVFLLKTEGFGEVLLRKDIFGKERMIKCRKDD